MYKNTSMKSQKIIIERNIYFVGVICKCLFFITVMNGLSFETKFVSKLLFQLEVSLIAFGPKSIDFSLQFLTFLALSFQSNFQVLHKLFLQIVISFLVDIGLDYFIDWQRSSIVEVHPLVGPVSKLSFCSFTSRFPNNCNLKIQFSF